jgi:hypothetical protein
LPLGTVATAQDIRTTFTVLSVGADGCWRFATPWTGAVCVGPLAERVRAQTDGISTPDSDARWLFGAQGTAAWHWRWWQHVGAFAALKGELRRPLEFRVRPYSEPIFEYPAFGAQILLGPEFWL